MLVNVREFRMISYGRLNFSGEAPTDFVRGGSSWLYL